MWHDTKEIVSEPRTVPRCFSLYYLDHSHNPSNTSCDPWPPGQLGAGRLPYYRRVCICVAHVNTADFGPRLIDISLVAIYFRELLRLAGPSQVSRHAAVGTTAGQVWTAAEPGIASETAVLLSRLPQPLVEHPPKRTTFYMLLSRKKLSKCV